MAAPLATLLVTIVALVAVGLGIAFILVPLFKGIGWLIAGFFRGVGWLFMHLFEFVGGMVSDALRLVGAVIAMVLLVPFPPLNIMLGRWSAAGHFAESISRECKVAAACVYRLVLRRPLKLLWLHGVLEGVEQRLPEAMAAAPTRDTPGRRTGQFDGYRIVGSLRGGGSGGKLYIAEPEPAKRQRIRNLPQRVVIKSFALTEGSSLPQIVRESRALEAAKQLGHVYEHGMDEHRFFYVMPYHAGEHLGVITRQLHGQSDGRGLSGRGLGTVLGYADDLLETLAGYHRGGLWHKDVKPENVIVHDGRANLVDLGLVTPLRSAMTLTTHGTEYFRDPEMVRQALRGVKVHQVDGAKFDVFAVGAVLYFMLENTFPAHGGLSRFVKKSPESLRWIVKRAMADYNQRYETADEMLADLRVVAGASDPNAVRPVDLPSMGGAAVAGPAMAAAADPQSESVERVGTPVPPPLPVSETPVPGPEAPASRRPSLRVTNWWTGAYAVDDAGSPSSADPAARDLRDQSRSFRAQARDLRRQVQAGAMTSRRAAREQIKSARARARDLQRRARTRHRSVAERQPSRALIGALVLFIGVLAVVALGLFRADRSRGVVEQMAVLHAEDAAATWTEGNVDGPPVLLLVEGENTHTPSVRTRIKEIMSDHSSDGFHVVLPDDQAFARETIVLVNEWSHDQDGPADSALEEILDEMDLYGFVWVQIDRDGNVGQTLIRSEWEDAADRRLFGEADVVAAHGEPGPPLLLVNDHPAKSDPRVEEQIKEIIARYERRRQPVLVDDDAEATVRQFLPADPAAPEEELPARLHNILLELEYAGVLRIGSGTGPGEPHERITVTRYDASPQEPAVETIPIEGAVVPMMPAGVVH